jgi:hypothetical protein
MSAEIIDFQTDTFRPRRPAATKEEEISVAASVNVLLEVEMWARLRRQITESTAKPPGPETMRIALELSAVIKNQPRVG